MSRADAKISEIVVSEVPTWSDRCFLTFDLDWACDEVIADTIDLVEAAGAAATWFVTHETKLLDRLRRNSRFELAIHPNYNPLLEGGSSNGVTVKSILADLRAVVPEATAVRCHSMTQSSRLQQLFHDEGFTHDCNHFIPEQAAIELKPWRLWNGLTKVPHFWEDDATAIYRETAPITELVQRHGLRVFDFHPIHVFLNTERLDRYEATRDVHRKPVELIRHRFTGTGTRSYLMQLLDACR